MTIENRGEVMVSSPLLLYGHFAKIPEPVFGHYMEFCFELLETFAI